MGLPNPSRETKFSGANADREIFSFPVQLTTSRIGKLTRLIHTLAICVIRRADMKIQPYVLLRVEIQTNQSTSGPKCASQETPYHIRQGGPPKLTKVFYSPIEHQKNN